MPQFEIVIHRVSVSETIMHVTAESDTAARKQAMETSGDHTYKEFTAEYEIDSSDLIPDPEPV